MNKKELIDFLKDVPDDAEIFIECEKANIPTKVYYYDISDTSKNDIEYMNYDFDKDIKWDGLDKNATAVLLS